MSEIAGWFATHPYLPKLRDRVVLEKAIAAALAKLDPKFAYADAYDEASDKYVGLIWQKAPFGPLPATAVLVRPEVAMAQLRPNAPEPPTADPDRPVPDQGQRRLRHPARRRPNSRRGSSARSRSTWSGRSKLSTRS